MLMLVSLLAICVVGCDKGSSPPATAPVVEPAEHPTTTSQPSTRPARPLAAMMIDQQQMNFPAAVLRLRPQDDQLHPTLSSDDPKEALDRDYKGNSFYFELPGTFSELADITQKPFNFVSESKEREDSPTGIFLQGNHYQLQPVNVKLELRGDAEHMEAWIAGTFLMFDLQDDAVPEKLVAVAGRLPLEVR